MKGYAALLWGAMLVTVVALAGCVEPAKQAAPPAPPQKPVAAARPVPAKPAPIRLDAAKVQSMVARADDLRAQDPRAALGSYQEAMDFARREMDRKKGAVNQAEMQNALDQASIGRALAHNALATRAADAKAAAGSLEQARLCLIKVRNKSTDSYEFAKSRLDRTEKDLARKAKAAEKPVVKPVKKPAAKPAAPKKAAKLEPAAAPKVDPRKKQVALKKGAVKPRPPKPVQLPEPPVVAKEPVKPEPAPKPEPKTEPKPEPAPAPMPTPEAATAPAPEPGVITLTPDKPGFQKTGSLKKGEGLDMVVVFRADNPNARGDLEVALPAGYKLKPMNLDFGGEKEVTSHPGMIFMRYVSLGLKPGARIKLHVERYAEGAGEYLIPIYIYPR